MELNDRIAGAVLGAFVGDSLSLGVHWIYNPTRIARLVGRLDRLIDPVGGAATYHPNRRAGQQTHYGDQTLALLRSVAERGRWDRDDFATRWAAMWGAYDGYVDGATKDTLTAREAGHWPASPGSESNDLAGVSRMAALLPALADADASAFERATREQTALTHGDHLLLHAAEFFGRLVHGVIGGAAIEDALEVAIDHASPELPARAWVEAARAHLDDEDPAAAVAALGADCHVPHAFPATIYLLLRFGDSLRETLVENAMAGGDSAARGMLLGTILGARDGIDGIPPEWTGSLDAGPAIRKALGLPVGPPAGSSRFSFVSPSEDTLDGRLEAPDGEVRGTAVFAHCFTCGKDIAAATRITRALARHGIAVLRFDFTGLGNSDGDFANTHFSSNVGDLVAAADALRDRYEAPSLLIGHSLGGAAVLAAAHRIPEVTGVVTIAAPADPAHVERLLTGSVEEIEREGSAELSLAGRTFTIRREFLDDVREQTQDERIATLGRALLVMHSPTDAIVSIDNAGRIFGAARHPKSFVSLAGADHLLGKKADSEYAAGIIAAWAGRLLG